MPFTNSTIGDKSGRRIRHTTAGKKVREVYLASATTLRWMQPRFRPRRSH